MGPPPVGYVEVGEEEDDAESGVGGEQTTTSHYNGFRTKLFYSMFIFTQLTLHGMNSHILGPSLLDLQYLTSSSTAAITTLFSWRFGGELLGLVLSGPVIDRVNEFAVLAMTAFCMGTTTAVLPLWRNLEGLALTAFLGGIAIAFDSVCISTSVVKIWGEDAKPYRQLILQFYSVGAAIVPQLVKPFLGHTQGYITPISNISQPVGNVFQNKEDIHTFLQSANNGSIQVFLGENITSDMTPLVAGTHIWYAYIILGSCLLASSLSSFIMFACRGCKFWSSFPIAKPTDTRNTDTLITGKPKMAVLSLFFVQCTLAGGIAEVSGTLLLTFVVEYLEWSKAEGSNITTVFFVSISISRLIGAVLAKYFKSSKQVAAQLAVLLAAIYTLTFTVSLHRIVPYICFTAIGLASGSLFAALVNWGQDSMDLKGKETSVFLAGLAFAKMAINPLIGYLFDSVGPVWFLYVTFIELVIFIPCYIITIVLIYYFQNLKKKELVNEKSPLVPLNSLVNGSE